MEKENYKNEAGFKVGDFISLKKENDFFVYKIIRTDPCAVWFFDFVTGREVWIENASVTFRGNV